MIRRNTWILLIVFIILLAGALWYSRQGAGDPAVASLTPTVEPLWFYPEVEIEELLIEDLETGERIRARRAPEVGWSLLEPEGEMAAVARIERAVSSLQLIQPLDRLQTNDYEQYGLEDPAVRIVLSLVDGSSRTLLVGRQAPTGDVYYARAEQSSEVLL
ncbi:MAG: DUF4340 domain-containing protein, partial [Anaerolineales bacterium]